MIDAKEARRIASINNKNKLNEELQMVYGLIKENSEKGLFSINIDKAIKKKVKEILIFDGYKVRVSGPYMTPYTCISW